VVYVDPLAFVPVATEVHVVKLDVELEAMVPEEDEDLATEKEGDVFEVVDFGGDCEMGVVEVVEDDVEVVDEEDVV